MNNRSPAIEQSRLRIEALQAVLHDVAARNAPQEERAQAALKFKLQRLEEEAKRVDVAYSTDKFELEAERDSTAVELRNLKIGMVAAEDEFPNRAKEAGVPCDGADGRLSLDELYDILTDSVETTAKEAGYRETPVLEQFWPPVAWMTSGAGAILSMISYWWMTGALTVSHRRVSVENHVQLVLGLVFGLGIGIGASMFVAYCWDKVGRLDALDEATSEPPTAPLPGGKANGSAAPATGKGAYVK